MQWVVFALIYSSYRIGGMHYDACCRTYSPIVALGTSDVQESNGTSCEKVIFVYPVCINKITKKLKMYSADYMTRNTDI